MLCGTGCGLRKRRLWYSSWEWLPLATWPSSWLSDYVWGKARDLVRIFIIHEIAPLRSAGLESIRSRIFTLCTVSHARPSLARSPTPLSPLSHPSLAPLTVLGTRVLQMKCRQCSNNLISVINNCVYLHIKQPATCFRSDREINRYLQRGVRMGSWSGSTTLIKKVNANQIKLRGYHTWLLTVESNPVLDSVQSSSWLGAVLEETVFEVIIGLPGCLTLNTSQKTWN